MKTVQAARFRGTVDPIRSAYILARVADPPERQCGITNDYNHIFN